MDDEQPAPWWCVSVPPPEGGPPCECPPCEDAVPCVWNLDAGTPSDPVFAEIGGAQELQCTPYSESVGCRWQTASDVPRWVLTRLPVAAAWVLVGQAAGGEVVRWDQIPDAEWNCCGENTFVNPRVPPGASYSWTTPSTVTLAPGGPCDGTCGGETTMECVQSQTEPVNVVSGPYATEEECAAACEGAAAPCIEGVVFDTAAGSNATGDCDPCGNGPLVNISTQTWGVVCEAATSFALTCVDGSYVLAPVGMVTDFVATLVSWSDTPPMLVYDVSGGDGLCGPVGGSIRLTITVAP